MADTLAPATQPPGAARQGLVAALRSCATEADIVQVLYQYLRSAYGYDVVALTVLEREGWYHAVGVDQGILQDVQRRRLVECDQPDQHAHGLVARGTIVLECADYLGKT